MSYLFIDTETTGFPKKHSIICEGQARVCQLAMFLTDENGKVLTQFSSLIKPDNWQVSKYNIDTCGITQENCENFGIHFVQAFGIFLSMAKKASLIVAHNEEFDRGMMNIEGHYSTHREGKGVVFIPPETPWHCTMKTNKHIMPGGKWPRLEEALHHYCGRSLGDKAHNAIYDAEACKDIFFATRKAA